MEWYIGNEWSLERKGLHKKVLELAFSKLQKPHQVARVVLKLESLENVNGCASNYLLDEKVGAKQELEMGTALTPLDCYMELLVRQMIVGEKALCTVQRKSASPPICFVLTLEDIVESKPIHKLAVREMYEVASRYKKNGVSTYKKYPLLAHEYFALAAKCLMSFKPFESLRLEADGIDADEMEALFVQVQTNLAACLLAQQRYDDVIYQTAFVESQAEPSEKSVYRRAAAYYNLKEFELAQRTIERVQNYQDKKDFVKLEQQIAESWKMSNDEYKTIMQRMFN